MESRILIFILFVSNISFYSCNREAHVSNDHHLKELRKKEIAQALKGDLPLITLQENQWFTGEEQKNILHSKQITGLFFDPKTKGPMLNEVFSISEFRPADITSKTTVCKSKECLRMEVYNYALNGTLIATALKEEKRLVDFNFYPEMQPLLNDKLTNLAVEIAVEDPVVEQFYGRKLKYEDSVMQGTKAALNRTKCQRSKHLCAAPTFVKDNKALWAIVDLTDLEVSGVEWTDVGRTGMPVTERSAQNSFIMESYCSKEVKLAQNGWDIHYNMTRSDGLKVYDVSYQGTPLIKSIKTVDWHVSYSERKGFGYSDAIGCPEFSLAAVIAVEPPIIRALLDGQDTVGFALVQNYYSQGWPSPCSYNYRQEFHFFNDGSFRPVAASLGRGCGTDGTYRPVTRIALAGKKQKFYLANKTDWQEWKKEQWIKEEENFPYRDETYLAKWTMDKGEEYWIESNQGQFNDAGRGDLAFLYVTVNHPDRPEGEADLPTIGPCCNTDYRQGPEKFINNESLKDQSLVLWYVPQIKNDGRKGDEYCWAESVLENGVYVAKVYPCLSGPMFHLHKTVIQ